MFTLGDIAKFALGGTCVGLVVGVLGWLCAKRRRYWAFAVGVTLLGFVAAFFLHYEDAAFFAKSASRERLYAVFELLSVAPLALVFLFLPGLLVRRGASARSILATSVATSIVAMPVWLFYGLALGCGMGIDCL
jgi:uncharacterized membrane protein YhaH (DUF805 family)